MVGRYNVQEPAPDPLLLPFLCSTAHSDSKDGLQDESPGSVAAAPDVERYQLRKYVLICLHIYSFSVRLPANLA